MPTPQNGQTHLNNSSAVGWTNMKMNFDNFEMVRSRKVDEKDRVICLVFMSPSWITVLRLSKILSFLHFFADVSNQSKAVIAVYVYAIESSRFTLLENGIGYYALTYSLEGISVWRCWISLNFCWFRTFFDVLFLNISWTVAQTPIKHIIF